MNASVETREQVAENSEVSFDYFALKAIKERGFVRKQSIPDENGDSNLIYWYHPSVQHVVFCFEWGIAFPQTHKHLYCLYAHWKSEDLGDSINTVINLNKVKGDAIRIQIIDLVLLPILAKAQYAILGHVYQGLEALPSEILYSILHKLDAGSLCNMAGVSKKFSQLSYTQSLWKNLCARDYPMNFKHIHGAVNYREIYKMDHVSTRHTRTQPAVRPTCCYDENIRFANYCAQKRFENNDLIETNGWWDRKLQGNNMSRLFVVLNE